LNTLSLSQCFLQIADSKLGKNPNQSRVLG